MESKNIHDYIVGVLGGMGPKSTSYFLDQVFERTEASCDQDHLNLVCLNHSTLPDRTELIQKNESQPLVDLLRKDISTLESLGVSFISIPCNTVFHFMSEASQDAGVPIISIVDSATEKLAGELGGNSVVGVMATEGTVQSGIYTKALESKGLQVVYPTKEMQDKINSLIYAGVKQSGSADEETLYNLAEKIRDAYNCNKVILACTELSYIRKDKHIPDYCLDTLDCLVEKTITLAGKKVRSQA